MTNGVRSARLTARHVTDEVADDVVTMLLLVPESARQGALLGALEGFCDQCRESEIAVLEEDRMYFVDIVVSRLGTASATVAAGNDMRRAS